MTPTRRRFLAGLMLGGPAALAAGPPAAERPSTPARRPIIDCTDLYHPPQDPGDNVDLVAAYALPEVDLKAVILDATQKYRDPPEGPRDAGFIPVTQLNSLFNRPVPCAVTPYVALKNPEDSLRDAPAFQQAGIDLLLRTLRDSPEPVDVLVFGAARAVAAAYNREPRLLRDKVRRVHLCAGSTTPEYAEWNVALDPHALVRLLRSDLPVAVYPCATRDGPFAYGPNNCFWKLENLNFIRDCHPRIRAYLAYALGRSTRVDFLRAVEEDPPAEVLQRVCAMPHNVWETCVWLEVSGRKLVRRADGSHRIVPAADVRPGDTVLPNDLVPCRLEVRDSGLFSFEKITGSSRHCIYDRGDPAANERALREALPALYRSFRP